MREFIFVRTRACVKQFWSWSASHRFTFIGIGRTRSLFQYGEWHFGHCLGLAFIFRVIQECWQRLQVSGGFIAMIIP